MPERDSTGRFIKQGDDGLKIVLTLPSISRILFWALFLIVLSPWIIILLRNQIWKEILRKFENLFL